MSIYSSVEYNVSYTATEQQSVRATTLFLEKVFAVQNKKVHEIKHSVIKNVNDMVDKLL